MVIPSKRSNSSSSVTINDILFISVGMMGGGLVALISLWFWLDYQTHQANSYLATTSGQLVGLLPLWLQELLSQQAQVMGLPLSGQTSAYWYMARAGGLIAYLLLWLSVMWGLSLSTKVSHNLIPAPIAYGLHEFLSIMTIVFILIHSFVLLGDNYINFDLFHLAIPFTAPYRPFWTGSGTVAFYLSVIMTGSFYIRKQIGQKTWRLLHYFTFAAYLLALGHGLMAGTDSPLLMIKLMYGSTGLGVLFLVYYRLLTLKFK